MARVSDLRDENILGINCPRLLINVSFWTVSVNTLNTGVYVSIFHGYSYFRNVGVGTTVVFLSRGWTAVETMQMSE